MKYIIHYNYLGGKNELLEKNWFAYLNNLRGKGNIKVGFCLYGQPRLFNEGFMNIMKFIQTQSNVEVDFFYHTWTTDDLYNSNREGRIHKNILIPTENVIDKLNKLYNPKKFSYDKQKIFDGDKYRNTIAWKNTENKNTISNTLSQTYSRSKVRNLLLDYIKKNNVNYDCIITTRFDLLGDIKVNLNDIDLSKIYVNNYHKNRVLFDDNLMILPVEDYLKLFDLYNNLDNILNNKYIDSKMKLDNEKLQINMEIIILAACYNNDIINKVIRTDLISDNYII